VKLNQTQIEPTWLRGALGVPSVDRTSDTANVHLRNHRDWTILTLGKQRMQIHGAKGLTSSVAPGWIQRVNNVRTRDRERMEPTVYAVQRRSVFTIEEECGITHA
jgi:hypothetical protein